MLALHKVQKGICNNPCLFLFLFTIFILHSRESELYRYILDGMSALAWELLFPRFLGPRLSYKGGGVPLSALPKNTTSEFAGLFFTPSINAERQAEKLWIPFFSFGMTRQGE